MWISSSPRASFLISAALRHLSVFLVAASVTPSEFLSLRPLVNVCAALSCHCVSVCTCQSQPVSYTNLCCQRDTRVRLGPLSRQLCGSYTTLQTSQHQSYCAAPLFFFFWGRLRSRQRCADNKEGSGPRNRNADTHTHIAANANFACIQPQYGLILFSYAPLCLNEAGKRETKYRKWLRPNDLVWHSQHGGCKNDFPQCNRINLHSFTCKCYLVSAKCKLSPPSAFMRCPFNLFSPSSLKHPECSTDRDKDTEHLS